MDMYKRFVEDFTMSEEELLERIRKEGIKANILATSEYLMGQEERRKSKNEHSAD